MEIEIKMREKAPLRENIGIPVSAEMKSRIETLKEEKNWDINKMVRLYLEKLIEQSDDDAA